MNANDHNAVSVPRYIEQALASPHNRRADMEQADRAEADQRELTVSETAHKSFASLVGRIRNLEASEALLGEVLATLMIDRNRQQLLDNPAENLPTFFQIADKWAARKRNIGFPDGQEIKAVAL